MSTCALFAGQAERGLEELIGQVSHPEVVELLYQYASQSEARGFRDVAISAYGDTPALVRMYPRCSARC